MRGRQASLVKGACGRLFSPSSLGRQKCGKDGSTLPSRRQWLLGPQSLNQNRGGTVSYDGNIIIGVNRGFSLGDRNKTIKASLRPHTGPHCKGRCTVFGDCLSNYLLCPKPPLYTLSLYKGLWSLGLLGCPILCARVVQNT